MQLKVDVITERNDVQMFSGSLSVWEFQHGRRRHADGSFQGLQIPWDQLRPLPRNHRRLLRQMLWRML